MKIGITGSSGLIGRALQAELSKQGHAPVPLLRAPESLSGLDAVIHLAGAPIADKRWSRARKAELFSSRVEGTRRIVETLARASKDARPKTLVSASAIGFYGDRGDEVLNEQSAPGSDFLSHLVKEWENETRAVETLGMRLVSARFGIVLSRDGGALGKMPPVILGSGRQWMSWVDRRDVVSFLIAAATDQKFSGVYNVVTPTPVTNADFTRVLGRVKGIPPVIKAPIFALKLALGEMATMLLASQRVLPTRALDQGFHFRHVDLEKSIRES